MKLHLFRCALTLAATAGGLSAATITNPSVIGPAVGAAFVFTPAPGNNNAPGATSPNVLVAAETVNSLGFGTWAIRFDTPNNAGSTEYNVIKEVFNNTGVAWDSFAIFYGPGGFFDPGAETANGVPLELDSDSAPSIGGPGTGGASYVNLGGDYFRWDNLFIPSGSSFTVLFAIDTCANCSGSWQIQQFATAAPVPEPATMGLIGLGLLGVGLARRRR